MERKAALSKRLAIVGVPPFADTFMHGGSSVLRMMFRAKNHRHRTLSKRRLGSCRLNCYGQNKIHFIVIRHFIAHHPKLNISEPQIKH